MPENVPEGSVVITPSEQYQRTAEQFGIITEKLGSLERTLDPVPAQVAEHDAFINSLREAGLPKSVTDMQADVKRIDRTLFKAAGVAGTLAALVSVAGSAIVQSILK